MLALWAFEWDVADWQAFFLSRVIVATVESLVALRESGSLVPSRAAESLVALLVAASNMPTRSSASLVPMRTTELA